MTANRLLKPCGIDELARRHTLAFCPTSTHKLAAYAIQPFAAFFNPAWTYETWNLRWVGTWMGGW